MKNIINSSELQRKGLKGIYETIDSYGEAFIVNQRSNKTLRLVDDSNPHLLLNIILNLKSVKQELKEKYGITKVGIAGSYSRGENTPKSDLDLIIDYNIKDMKEFVRIEELISNKISIKNIDLLTFDGVAKLALKSIEKDVIYV